MINEIWRRMGAQWKASCVAISLLLVLLLLAACVVPVVTPEPPTEVPAAAEPAGPSSGGTLVIAMDAEADILDNQAGGGWITWRVNRNMFDTLVMEDLTQEDVAIPPRIGGLAESWEVSDDGLEYTFYLRQGVKFHDGTDFNAEVVKWNVDRMWNEDAPQYSAKAASCTAFSWQALDHMEIVDDYTIKFVMSRPFGEFIGKLVDGGCGNTSLMSPTNWEKWGNDEIGEHPVGTGPFKFVERVRGEKIVLEKWDGYWGKELGGPYQEPYLDRLIFRPMPDPAARIAALEAGEVDMVWSPPPDSVEDMVKKGFTLSKGPTPHIWYWNLNLQEPCYDDIKVRQAINHAIDREGMARDLLRETVLPAYSMMVPGSRAFDPDLKIEYDLEKAKQLMAESSCPDGFTTKWLVPTGGSGNIIPVPMAEWIQRDLRAIGIDMELETYEWQTYLSFWWKGIQPGEGAYMMSWGMTTPFWIDVVAHSKWFAPDGSNIGWYENPEVDALLDQALAEVDDANRLDLYKQANDLIVEDGAFVPVVHDSAPYLLAPYVKDFPHAPQEWMDFRTVWLDK